MINQRHAEAIADEFLSLRLWQRKQIAKRVIGQRKGMYETLDEAMEKILRIGRPQTT